MRVAVISDIHANLHALEAVLAEIDREPPDALWSLGDVVGYGPRPNECAALVAERASLALVGNHDLAALGDARVPLEEFNDEAAEATLWTRAQLTDATRDYLASLTPRAAAHGVELFHGSPVDPVWAYVLTAQDVVDSFERSDVDVLLVGHSHVALAVALRNDRLAGGVAGADLRVAFSEGRVLLNPGSVGQPRDGDPRAAFLVLDLERRFAAFRRVPYAIEKTQNDLRERGLPAALADRLAHGQ